MELGVSGKRCVMCNVTVLVTLLLTLSSSGLVRASYNFIRCGECDETRCPELHYCEGQAIKDHCGCCTVCSSSKFQPHVMIAQPHGGNACDQVKCPKMKVCVVNMQGLPLCTCPSLYVCRGVKNREVCGTDDRTYASRCHMRIASCNEGVTVRKKHRGMCSEKNVDENETSNRRRVNKMKKKERKRRKNDGVAEDREEERRRNKNRRRKRRKSGKHGGRSRSRRHRGRKQAKKNFEEVFSHYTWKA